MPTRSSVISDISPIEGIVLDTLSGDAEVLLGHRRFRAMNTDIQLFTRDSRHADVLRRTERIFHEMERRLSRFRPDSELSRLNLRSGDEVTVSPELFRVLDAAQEFCRVTVGVFDPAVLPQLEAAGYDRSFELIPEISPDRASTPACKPAGSLRQVRLDARRLTVRAPPGVRLDLGGIGKGYVVDRAAELMDEVGDFLIDAGGDIFASGKGPDGLGWPVSVANPFDVEAEDVSVLRLWDEALATSTTAVRRWERGGQTLNHLIDTRTGQPIGNNVVSVSVIAPSATEADVLAKTALMLGHEKGRSLLESQRAAGLFVLGDQTCRRTRDWPGDESANQEEEEERMEA